MDFMSSDDSAADEEEEVFVTRPLPWRSERVGQFFKHLDDALLKDKSPQSKRQRKRRVLGLTSSRPAPMIDDIPDWVFTNDQ